MIVNQKSRYSLKLFSDLLLIDICFIISAVLAQSLDTLLSRPRMFFLLFVLDVLWYFTTRRTSIYDGIGFNKIYTQAFALVKNSVFQIIASIIFIFAAKEDLFTRNFILYYAVSINVVLFLRILVFRKIERSKSNEKNLKKLIIVCANQTGIEFATLIEQNPGFGYNFVGFVGSGEVIEKSEKYLGSFDNFEKILTDYKVEEVVVSAGNSEHSIINNVISVCDKNALRAHIIPDFSQFLSRRYLFNMVESFPVITMRNEPLLEFQSRFLKRSFDLVFTLIIFILILWWLIPLLALLVKIFSPGPAFFVQDRIGLRNKVFKCYKFRTMRVSSKKNGGEFIPTTKNDERVTLIGSFLRRTSLDEIPQFFNILKGEMSIVGPRPHAVKYNEEYLTYFGAIKLRHLVKPGLTGWAQAHGLRGDVADYEENKKRTIKRIEHDIWYIENWSFGLDVQIVLLTVWQILTGVNAGR